MISKNSQTLLEANNVRLVCKDELWWMKLLGFIAFWNKSFMTEFWTTVTIGSVRVITYPVGTTYEKAIGEFYTIVHEIEHVRQADALAKNFPWRWLGHLWFYVRYLFLPFPILFADWRFKYEAEAYVKSFKARLRGERIRIEKLLLDNFVDSVVDTLWKGYLFPQSKDFMRARLVEALHIEYVSIGKVLES